MQLVRVLLPIDQHGTTEACAAVAFALASRFRIEVEALHPCPPAWQRLPYSSELSPFAVQELIEVEREQALLEKRHAKAWFRKMAKAFPKVKATFAAGEGLVGLVVSKHARMADFSVVPGISEAEGAFWNDVREGALFSSGRPMLVVPQEALSKRADTVVVAWKDRPEAVRAIVAAAPFLAKAKRVRVMSVTGGDRDDGSLAAITDYLTGAGVAAEAATVPQGSREVGEILVAEAGKQKSAMLVMGAYGHSRLRQWVFGGATSHVLRNATVPVLMVH
jgi:nucleotide-binding universal stress UspA family protein